MKNKLDLNVSINSRIFQFLNEGEGERQHGKDLSTGSRGQLGNFSDLLIRKGLQAGSSRRTGTRSWSESEDRATLTREEWK